MGGVCGEEVDCIQVLMGHVTEIESLKELNADENILTK
jgi:hypothetical protein